MCFHRQCQHFLFSQVLQGGCTESPTKPKGRPRKEIFSNINEDTTAGQTGVKDSYANIDVEHLGDNDNGHRDISRDSWTSDSEDNNITQCDV